MSDLRIAQIEYSIAQQSIDIFTIGCDGHCEGCCNPEIKDWDAEGTFFVDAMDKIYEYAHDYDNMFNRIIIVGGDPVDAYKRYHEQFTQFIEQIRHATKLCKEYKPIYLFTRHELTNIPSDLKNLVDYIKTGPYIPDLITKDHIEYGIRLATSNQHIYKKGEDF